MTNPARIRRLTLTNFRSYHAATLAVGDGPVVLVGPNGAGKTNLLEAISFLAPGRGLRRATLEEVAFGEGDGAWAGAAGLGGAPGRGLRRATLEEVAFGEGDGAWAVSAELEGALGLVTIGTGIEPPTSEDAMPARKCRIDREPAASATAFADHLRVIWLVPAMDGLFAGPGAERRRFIDRLVLAVDAEHGSRVNAVRTRAPPP